MEKKNILVFSIVGIAIIIVIILLFIVNPFSADPPAITQTAQNEVSQTETTPPADNQAETGEETTTSKQADEKPKSASSGSKSTDMHVVSDGETLKSIAQDVYGDEKMWFKIFLANEGTIDWYDTIYVGQKLKLPKE